MSGYNNTINNMPLNTRLDMATAIKIVPKFAGTTEEGVLTWRKSINLLLRIWDIPETSKMSIYVSALKVEALSWASEHLSITSNNTLTNFLENLQKRFAGDKKISKNFGEVTSRIKIKTSKEFLEHMGNSAFLFNIGCMGTSGLLNALLPHLNDNSKAMLWTTISEGREWSSFPNRSRENNLDRLSK